MHLLSKHSSSCVQLSGGQLFQELLLYVPRKLVADTHTRLHTCIRVKGKALLWNMGQALTSCSLACELAVDKSITSVCVSSTLQDLQLIAAYAGTNLCYLVIEAHVCKWMYVCLQRGCSGTVLC